MSYPILLLAALLSSFALASPAAGMETISLVPEDRASWRPIALFGWLRPRHYYGERSVEIDTTPPGATVDLFYVRSNFQKRYEQAEAPVKVLLPRRVEAGPRDAITIRAFREGYRQREVSVRVSSSQKSVHIELEPLPNLLVGVGHTYFSGRTSLSFLTKEALTVRVQEEPRGFNVVLAETGKGPELGDELVGIRSPAIAEVEPLQLGEDLLVRVTTTAEEREAGFELRSRQMRDELRNLHVYAVDMVPADGGVEAVQRARAALARIQPGDVTGCPARFDDSLRGSLDAADLSRALAPRGAFTDPYLRAAMKRLGEVSPGGKISLLDGSTFDPRSSIELAAAMSQPADAKGYLALLRTFVGELETEPYRQETFRSLIAPEVSASRFARYMEKAQRAESLCLASL